MPKKPRAQISPQSRPLSGKGRRPSESSMKPPTASPESTKRNAATASGALNSWAMTRPAIQVPPHMAMAVISLT